MNLWAPDESLSTIYIVYWVLSNIYIVYWVLSNIYIVYWVLRNIYIVYWVLSNIRVCLRLDYSDLVASEDVLRSFQRVLVQVISSVNLSMTLR